MRLKFSLLLAGAYLLVAILFTLGYLTDMGHGSNPFGFLFHIVFSACHLIDLLPVVLTVNNMPVRFLICVVEGTILYGLVGLIIDFVLGRYRRS